MKKISLLFVVMLLAACGATELETPVEDDNPIAESTLGVAFVAGHFGSYWDCPGDAYQSDGDAGARAAQPDEGPGLVAGDCAEEDCGGFLNCEPAQVTVQIENIGDGELRGIHVREIQVLNSKGAAVAVLPVLSVDALDLQGYQGRLNAGAAATLRIEFQGPHPVRELLNDGSDRAPVRVIIEVDEQEPSELETPAIEALGQIAT